MSEINYLNKKFENAGVIKTGVALGKEDINEPVVHQIIKAILAGKRQGTACTKTKALVSGGGKKPFKQKGTGRARQGSSRSPIFPGGGTIFGPTPRSYEQKINKKMMTIAIQSVLADKFQAGKLTVVEKLESNGKTKDLVKLLEDKKLLPSLVITNSAESLVLRAAKNIKNAKAFPVDGFSVYEAVKYENLLMEKEAFEKLLGKMV